MQTLLEPCGINSGSCGGQRVCSEGTGRPFVGVSALE